MYIFVCLKSQRCSNHSHIRQNSSVFVSIRQLLMLSTDNASFKAKTYEQAVQIYLCQWFEEPAMLKPLSYSSEFVSIRQPFVFSTDNASFKAKNIRAGSPDLFMSMSRTLRPSHRKSKLEDRNVINKTRTEIVIQGLLAGSRLTGLKI